MIHKDTLRFLSALKRNNDRDWFTKHKEDYEAAKANVEEVVGDLIVAISAFDPSVKGVEPKKALFRIYRDTRFATDKTPYKTNFGAAITAGGYKSGRAGYYLHVEPGKSFIAGGLHGGDAKTLTKLRRAIDTRGQELRRIISASAFKKAFGELVGDTVKTAPRGYAKDHPHIDLLRHKDIIAWHMFSDANVQRKDFVKQAGQLAKKLKPFDDWLNDAVGK